MINTIAGLRDSTPTKDDRRILNFQHKGYVITLGKNSFSNERVVADHPHKECLWMHAMAARGSHIILCVEGRPEPDDEVLQYAAKLAILHSHSQARTVSVSILRDVFKPDNCGVGVWKTSKSISVEAAE